MSDPKDEKKPGKKLNTTNAQKLREQLANRISELSDEELERVSGGTSVEATTDIVVSALVISSNACPSPVSDPSTIPTAVGCD